MNTDFSQIEKQITDFISENFPAFLRDGLEKPKFINDFLDLDKYKFSNTVFFEFNSWNFDYLQTHEQNGKLDFNLFIVCRNDKNLKEKCLNYATDFYRFFEETGKNLNGLADFGKINYLTMFDAFEGNPEIKVTELTITLNLEI